MTKEIYLAFDHKAEDRFFWLSDIGWMMGPWTIIGNHNFGGTIFLYDGAPDFPTPDRMWQMIERHRITTFGISPTAIRLLMRTSSPRPVCRCDSLRLLGSTGEPWDDTSYMWFFENVGQAALSDHQYFRRHGDRRLLPVPAAHSAAEGMHSGRTRAGHGDGGCR